MNVRTIVKINIRIIDSDVVHAANHLGGDKSLIFSIFLLTEVYICTNKHAIHNNDSDDAIVCNKLSIYMANKLHEFSLAANQIHTNKQIMTF